MPDFSLHKFHIEENLPDLESDTRKITKNYNGYYLLDFYKNFKLKMPDLKITINDFLSVIKKNPRYVVTHSNEINKIIISLSECYDENVVKKELNRNTFVSPFESMEGQSNAFTTNESRNKNVDDKVISNKNKKEIYNEKYKESKKEKYDNYRNKFDNSGDRKNNFIKKQENYKNEQDNIRNNQNNFKNNNDTQKNENNDDLKNKNPYEHVSDSNESEEIKPIQISKGKKKQPHDPKDYYSKKRQYNQFDNRTQVKEHRGIKENKKSGTLLRTYQDYKDFMLDALEHCSAFLLTTFQNAMNLKHGHTFDHKRAPANKIKPVRAKLSNYLDDCDDIFARIAMRNNLYYKRLDLNGKFLVEKRINAHLKPLPEFNYLERNYHIEMLLVNIFPVKTTAEVSEVEVIFEKVYNVSISSVLEQGNLKDFLIKTKSPNMILKDSKEDAKVTLIPTYDEEYKDYGDLDIHNQILAIESNILNNAIGIQEPEAKESEDEIFNFEVPVKGKHLFDTDDINMIGLLDNADLNIPACLREIDEKENLETIFAKCKGKEFGYSTIFPYLQQNIKFSFFDTYFDL